MKNNKANASAFDSIKIEGGLLTSELLNKLRHYDLPGQSAADYSVEEGLKLNDELGRYWRIAKSRWEKFNELRQREDVEKHQLTVDEWLVPLFEKVLDYRVSKISGFEIGERTFPINHVTSENTVPLVLFSCDLPLDQGHTQFGEEGQKRSPSGLAQEYLNAEDQCLWALVSNGLTLRLLRDNPAMTRPAYVEIDLERIFEEDLYVDFTVFWLLLHATRLQPQDGQPENCFLEQWREQGDTEGERVRKELRYGVTDALRILGTGFVSHPDNNLLRELIQSGELKTDQFFQELLRLIYRFLFLLTAEDRNVLLDPDAEATARNLYEKGYSISNLREQSRLRRHYDNHIDAWKQLVITFRGFAIGQAKLGQPAMGGLFAMDQCPHLERSQLANRYLYKALFKLSFFISKKVLVRINYRDMGTEELGSVYESLLELIPVLSVETPWKFGFEGDDDTEVTGSGHQRKLTGSYYTPDSLVKELIQTALEPVIEQTLQINPADPAKELLNITICDPACGSGHFLLAAARRLAVEVARIEAGADQPTENHYHHSLREVVRHCIYGVDVNPLAVELCRTALWLEAIEPGKPLGFLDAHIQIGNSLVGVVWPQLLDKGIPDDAFKLLVADDKEAVSALKKRNKINPNQKDLFESHTIETYVCAGELEVMPEESLEQIEQKRDAWLELTNSIACQNERLRADLFTAAFFLQKSEENIGNVPSNIELSALDKGGIIPSAMKEQINAVACEYKFFHWYLAFPEIMEKGGFDVILGNPPWDKIQAEEQSFFSTKDLQISKATGHKRKDLIKLLENENPKLYSEFISYRRKIACMDNFVKKSGNYLLTGKGKVNTYALFSELTYSLISKRGRGGIVVPLGIATDDYTKAFYSALVKGQKLVSLYGFENENFVFPSVHHAFKFVLMTIAGEGSDIESADYAFFCRDVVALRGVERRYTLSFQNIININPNTQTSPIFRTRYDAEINNKIYSRFPVVNSERKKYIPWNCGIHRMFNPTDDSKLFVTRNDNDSVSELLPIYEGKMIHQYDHRFGSYEGQTEAQARQGKLPELSDKEHSNPDAIALPRHWLPKVIADAAISRHTDRNWLIAYRDITSSVVLRTVIACVIPRVPAVDPCRIIYMPDDLSAEKVCCFLGCLNSLVFDYCARQKVSGNHLAIFVFKQLPVLDPEQFSENGLNYIVPRVLELTYTSYDLKHFAEDLGYVAKPFSFDSDRRHQIKCELDAYYAKLYDLTRDELRYILNPSDVMGEDYPSETFRVLMNKEIKEFGEYRTGKLVLREFDRLTLAEKSGQPYQSLLDPQPGVAVQPSYSSIGVIRHDNDARLVGFILTLIKTAQNLPRTQFSLAMQLIQQSESAKLNVSDSEFKQLERFSLTFTGSENADSFDRVQEFLRYLEQENTIRTVDQGKSFSHIEAGEIPVDLLITPDMEAAAQVVLQILNGRKATEQAGQDVTAEVSPKQA